MIICRSYYNGHPHSVVGGMIGYPKRFTLHGLWPANSTGYSLKCAPPPEGTSVWTTDGQLRTALQKCWYSLIRGRPNYILWKHEWKDYGYCSSHTIKDTDYFWAAVRKHGRNTKIAGDAIVNELSDAEISPSNDKVNKKSAITSALSEILDFNNQVDAERRCETESDSSHHYQHSEHHQRRWLGRRRECDTKRYSQAKYITSPHESVTASREKRASTSTIEEAPPAVKKLLLEWLTSTINNIFDKPAQKENGNTAQADIVTTTGEQPLPRTGNTYPTMDAGNDALATVPKKTEEMENEKRRFATR
uniref:Uncharacterized protein n=2 Tax=Nicotiana TaxID=4085 RepID=A0A1S4A8X1_TOBAC|nr:PREDICTED: uncharacterized protein LOC107795038 [Nicotiana tabacum]